MTSDHVLRVLYGITIVVLAGVFSVEAVAFVGILIASRVRRWVVRDSE